MDFPLTRAVLDAGLAGRAFPGAAVEVGRAAEPLWRTATGRLRYEPDAPPCGLDTVFDLASLTKVIATASIAMRLCESGALDLQAPVSRYLPAWSDAVHESVRVRHLLDHSSGLPAHERLWERARGRDDYESEIHACGFDRPVGASAVYSDLGFLMLGFILEDRGRAPIDHQMRELAMAVGAPALEYLPPASWRDRTAPTEFDPWRDRLLVGEVHDENAAALGGVAGHAGLFGTAGDVGAFARAVLRTFSGHTSALGAASTMRTFAARSAVTGSSRALGWDTMLLTSSCGRRLSASAIGHTGFTGTSLWIDPEQDLYVVLLSNRVYPTRNNDGIRAVRPRLHDAVVEDLERGAL
ncbi:MAG: serine hydrolase domain-containing protein [Acidobacteriota bacterium]